MRAFLPNIAFGNERDARSNVGNLLAGETMKQIDILHHTRTWKATYPRNSDILAVGLR